MKTDDLLELLSRDESQTRALPSLGVAALIGIILTFFGLLILPLLINFGVRPNYFRELTQGFVAGKQFLPIGLACLIWPILRHAMHPEADIQLRRAVRLFPYFIAITVLFAIGLATENPETRGMAMRGKSLPYCLSLVPTFSIPIFLAVIRVIQNGAPASPMLAGLWSGLFAGAAGCAIYAFTCVDDNPMFWTWAYTLGIMISGMLGAMVGKYALKW